MAKKKPNKIVKFLTSLTKRERVLAIALIIMIAICAGLAHELYLTPQEEIPQRTAGEPPIAIVGDGLFSIEGGLNIYFLDVGQGESIYIDFPDGTNMLIDAGRGTSENAQFTANYLTFFDEMDINTINYLMLTHSDSDHCNMLDDVVETLEIKHFFLNDYPTAGQSQAYLAFINAALAEEGATYDFFDEDGYIYYVESEQREDFPYKMTIFAPGHANPELSNDANSNCPICLLEYADRYIFLGGDAPSGLEAYYIEWLKNEYPTGYDIDVLKVSHHGSKGSTDYDFLEFFTPEYAIISCGEVNSYDHPSAMLMNRLYNEGIVTYRTNRHGTILLSISSEGYMQFSSSIYAHPENNKLERDTLYISSSKR